MNQLSSIDSNQKAEHERLATIVRRHLAGEFRKPVADHSLVVFQRLKRMVDEFSGPLILDSGCGVGESTRHLAALYPRALVIGVDKSFHRLKQAGVSTENGLMRVDNAIWLRADLVDLWCLARRAGWRLWRHFLLYPNPWPKSTQLQRRWHAHAVFPSLLALGGLLELRGNWPIYVREMACALAMAGVKEVKVETFKPAQYWTPFERKYALRGEALYRLQADLGTISTPSADV